jgi:hypothetical protein
VGEVTQLLQQLLLLLEERETYFSPSQHLKDLFTQKIPNNHQSQDHGEQLTEWSRLVEPFVYKKGAGTLATALSVPRFPAQRTLHNLSSNLLPAVLVSSHK